MLIEFGSYAPVASDGIMKASSSSPGFIYGRTSALMAWLMVCVWVYDGKLGPQFPLLIPRRRDI